MKKRLIVGVWCAVLPVLSFAEVCLNYGCLMIAREGAVREQVEATEGIKLDKAFRALEAAVAQQKKQRGATIKPDFVDIKGIFGNTEKSWRDFIKYDCRAAYHVMLQAAVSQAGSIITPTPTYTACLKTHYAYRIRQIEDLTQQVLNNEALEAAAQIQQEANKIGLEYTPKKTK